jgi:hypothetical protein
VFFKVNNNQEVDSQQNQVMRYIVCHDEIVGSKILTLCIRCRKGLIAYNKARGISTMEKHVEQELVPLNSNNMLVLEVFLIGN